jgi:hypothetical protein
MLQSKNSRHRCFWLAVIDAMVVVGCRPSEPVPSYNEDLGTEASVLLPASSEWYDPAVAKGQADWRPFRKPGAESKSGGNATGEAKPAGRNESIESELRTLVSDFNAAIAANKFDEAIDFLIEEQIAPAKQAVEDLPTLWGKIKELAEVLPGDNENLKIAVADVSLPAVLKLEVASITVSNPTEAVGKLTAPAGVLGVTGLAVSSDLRFVLVKEKDGEYWYIDHPQIRAMAAVLPKLQQSLPQLDAFIAGVKSGQIGGDALVQRATMINQMLGTMLPSGSQPGAEPTKGEPEGDAKPDEGSGE